MSTATPLTKRKLVTLAEQICQDIRDRGLRPGDVYLTADEAAKHLSVTKTDANRALQLLASRRLLTRKQGSAPRLARELDARTETAIHRVHVLIPEADIKKEGLFSDGNMIGLQEALPGCQIQFNFLPERGEAEYVSGLVHEALAATRLEGFVLLRSSLNAQQAVADSGLPAVVNGTVYPSVANICSMDRDHKLSAKLQLDYVSDCGCKHVLVLMRDRMYAGDQIFFEAVMAECAARPGLNAPPLFHFLPSDEGMVLTTISDAVNRLTGKVGVITRSMDLGAASVTAAGELGLSVPGDLPITVCDYHPSGPSLAVDLPHELDADWSPQAHGKKTGLLLLQQARGEVENPVCITYGTRFVIPDP